MRLVHLMTPENNDLSLVVLAAGMGSRYGGLKQLDGLGPTGETILEYSIYDAIQAGFGRVVFVIRSHFEQDFREQIGSKFEDIIEIAYVHQEVNPVIPGIDHVPERDKPWGTAQAVHVAAVAVPGPFAVINADDYYGQQCFHLVADFLRTEASMSCYGMIGYRLDNTLSEQGHVNRGVCSTDEQGRLKNIQEVLKISRVRDQIVDGSGTIILTDDTVVSMNFWAFHQDVFRHLDTGFPAFVRANLDRPTAEYYIPVLIDNLIASGEVEVKVITSPDQWYGVTYREDAPAVRSALADFARDGQYPNPLWPLPR